QTTGVQRCQCRKQRAQRNHIPASLLAWAYLHQAAMLAKTTVYALKQGLLDDYLCQQLRNPAFAKASA
ncbi:MAG: transposase, partial [SAR324 cluster bacterium]|nr:transposase [SAR324 cluster bacterium]